MDLRTRSQSMYDENNCKYKDIDYGYTISLYRCEHDGFFHLIVDYQTNSKNTRLCMQVLTCKEINTLFITSFFGHNFWGYDSHDFYDFSEHNDVMEFLAYEGIYEFLDILDLDENVFIAPYTPENFTMETNWFKENARKSIEILDLPSDITEKIYNINKPKWLIIGESDITKYHVNMRRYVYKI